MEYAIVYVLVCVFPVLMWSMLVGCIGYTYSQHGVCYSLRVVCVFPVLMWSMLVGCIGYTYSQHGVCYSLRVGVCVPSLDVVHVSWLRRLYLQSAWSML